MQQINIRELIHRKEILVLPGIYDALTAKIAQKAGFQAILMGGFSVSAIRLGQPDVGYLTMSEMVSQIKIISEAAPIPLIADGDTGYGNPLNVMRTVRDYEKAGATGIILEDQQWPKKCGHMEGKQVIPLEDHVKKIEAALEARSGKDFIIIARTDSLAVHSMEDAIKRGKAFRDAGADVVFVEAPKSVEELAFIRKSIKGIPLVANIIEGGKTPYLSAQTLEKMGYEIMFCGLTAILVIAKAFMDAMIHLKREGSTERLMEQMFTFSEFNELMGIKEFSRLEKRFKS